MAQDPLQDAPGLSCPDHVHVELGKCLGMLRHGRSQRLARTNPFQEQAHDLLKFFAFHQLGQDREAPVEREPCPKQCVHLLGKMEEFLLGHISAGKEGKGDLECPARCLTR